MDTVHLHTALTGKMQVGRIMLGEGVEFLIPMDRRYTSNSSSMHSSLLQLYYEGPLK